MASLEARQLADLTFQEVSRSLRALSSTYVERREKLKEGAALAGAGKRAAFALFYGPLHFLLIRRIVAELGDRFASVPGLVDLGCGTGASGAGWAAACARPPRIIGVDRHPWAIEEAKRTFRDLGLSSTLHVDDLTKVDMRGQRLAPTRGARTSAAPRPSTTGAPGGVLLAFAVNEIAEADARATLLARLLAHHASGGRVIVVEPLARGVTPWWSEWQRAVETAGGRADEWRFVEPLPDIVARLDRAAGLNHRELKARSLAL